MSGTPSQTRFGCYIGNIDRSVTIDMLKQVFCQCGTIFDCSLNGRDGDPYRFGFIDFATEDDRARAMKYNGFTLVGRKLKVGISKGNVNKPEGFANGNPGGSSSPGHNAERTRPGNPNFRGDGDGAATMNATGLTTQQQIEARLLLQFLQEGKMDPRQLSAAQQQLLIASLGHGSTGPSSSTSGGNNGAMLSGGPSTMVPQQPPMGNPMMTMMGGGAGGGMPPHQGLPMMSANMHMNGGQRMMMDGMGQGGYGGPGMMPHPQQQQQQRSPQPWGAGMQPGNANMYSPMGSHQQAPPQQQQALQQQQQQPYGASGAAVLSGSNVGVVGQGYGSAAGLGGLVNASPSGETLRLREKQREQYFEVVRKDTEKYERKLQEKRAQVAAGDALERSESSASDEDEKPSKKSKNEASGGH